MKPIFVSVVLVVALSMLAGCASPPRGAAHKHEQEVRRQLANSVPMKDYGYTIKELRFSDGYKKALVVFTHPDTRSRPDWEFVLTADEFGRYRGMNVQPFYTPGTANTPGIYVTVTLPPK